MVLHDRVAQREIGMHPIEIVAADPPALDVAGVLEVPEDAVGVPFGDFRGGRDVPNPRVGTLRERK